MSTPPKYTPHPALSWLHRASVALYVLAPAAALWTFAAGFSGLARAATLALAILAYLGYLLFAIVLHKECYPERPATAAALLLLPPLGGIATAVFAFGLNGPAALAATGWIAWLAVDGAVALLFAAGTHLVAARIDAPGESPLAWRRAGRGLWTDPDFAPMARWSIAAVFFLPATLVAVLAAVLSWDALLALPAWRALAAGFIALVATCLAIRRAARAMIGFFADGRVFGPGKDAFD